MSAAQPERRMPSRALSEAARAALTAADPRFAEMLDDPSVVARLEATEREAARVRAATARGADPADLGFVDGGLEQVMRERGT